MSKNRFFIGQPVFSQIIKLIPKSIICQARDQYNSDRYVKRFKTYDHLITMLYCCLQKCESLRELTIGLQASMHRLEHLGLSYTPRRSTISDANKRRTEKVFEYIFHELSSLYYPVLPDSSKKKTLLENLFIVDSTTISLFSSIMKGAGGYDVNGKKKGGAKAHMMISAEHDVPVFARITEAKHNDQIIMDQLPLPRGAFVVFDKAYVNSRILHQWTEKEISWVTRPKVNSSMIVLASIPIQPDNKRNGVLSDQLIKSGRRSNKATKEMLIRLVNFHDAETNRQMQFITNNFELSPREIAEIYKRRWQIEILFKRWKSHSPLKYFLGNNPNAIKIQIWVALIADMLIQVIRRQLRMRKAKWSFSNLAGLIRQQLFSYINLYEFLKNPQQALLQLNQKEKRQINQMDLFDTS